MQDFLILTLVGLSALSPITIVLFILAASRSTVEDKFSFYRYTIYSAWIFILAPILNYVILVVYSSNCHSKCGSGDGLLLFAILLIFAYIIIFITHSLILIISYITEHKYLKIIKNIEIEKF